MPFDFVGAQAFQFQQLVSRLPTREIILPQAPCDINGRNIRPSHDTAPGANLPPRRM